MKTIIWLSKKKRRLCNMTDTRNAGLENEVSREKRNGWRKLSGGSVASPWRRWRKPASAGAAATYGRSESAGVAALARYNIGGGGEAGSTASLTTMPAIGWLAAWLAAASKTATPRCSSGSWRQLQRKPVICRRHRRLAAGAVKKA